MLHLWVIALFAGLALRDSLEHPLLHDAVSGADAAWATLGSMFLIGMITHVVVWRLTARVRKTGSFGAVLGVEHMVAASRWLAVAVNVVGVLALGWLDAVRAVLGDIVAVDEMLALSPAVVVFGWGWWASYPLDRALRRAAMLRRIDEGEVVYDMPSRAAFVSLNLRHHVIVWLTPLMLILAWTEGSRWIIARLGARAAAGDLLADADVRELVGVGVELVGIGVVFMVLGPLAMRHVWNTTPLPAGELRDRLEAMCRRYRVRVSNVLVWLTHGTMINGAVLGLTPAFRYVLLTDALLDSLPDAQVEAVMAHEVAHVRHRHTISLAGIMILTIGLLGWGMEQGAAAAGWIHDDQPIAAWLTIAITVGSLGGVLVVFGLASRRFEWQADAFAAAHMSEQLRAAGSPGGAVSHEGAAAMAGALRAVARLNHVPEDRRSWRHGSIAVRVRRLEALVGAPLSRTPIDVTARRMKRATLAGLAGLAALTAIQFARGG